MSEQHWLTKPKTIRKLWVILIAVLVITVIAGMFIEFHAHFGIESSFAFYAWYGFGTCVLMVAGAKLLGIFLKRPDSYYD